MYDVTMDWLRWAMSVRPGRHVARNGSLWRLRASVRSILHGLGSVRISLWPQATIRRIVPLCRLARTTAIGRDRRMRTSAARVIKSYDRFGTPSSCGGLAQPTVDGRLPDSAPQSWRWRSAIQWSCREQRLGEPAMFLDQRFDFDSYRRNRNGGPLAGGSRMLVDGRLDHIAMREGTGLSKVAAVWVLTGSGLVCAWDPR